MLRSTTDGVPFEVVFFNAPTSIPTAASNTTSFYVSDSWTIGRRLTLNLGLRYAHDAAFAPEQTRDAASGSLGRPLPRRSASRGCELNIWNSVAPRLHAAYDLSGDGKTVIKGGWGRYDHMRQLDAGRAALSSRTASPTGIYQWRDLNGNNDYDAGEVNLDPNGPDFVERPARSSTTCPRTA